MKFNAILLLSFYKPALKNLTVKLLSMGCPFCILAVCGVLFIVAIPHCVWVCTGGLSRFLG